MRTPFRAGRRLYNRAGALALVAAAVGAGAALTGCGGSSDTSGASSGGSSSGSGGGTQLALVGYSTPKKAYGALTDAFAKTSGGEGVTFSQSFGASGSQSRAVDSGQPADVVAFSTTPDMTRLVDDGLVAKSWDTNPAKGMSSDSVVVMVVRKGNPKHITGWDDLIKPGIDVITPNPSTSGSARWNILAGYGAQLKEGKTPGPGACLRQDAADQERQRPGLERQFGPEHVQQRQGRRAARLRVRRDRGPEGRRFARSTSFPSRRS